VILRVVGSCHPAGAIVRVRTTSAAGAGPAVDEGT
jgi:hypothetical protein